MHNIFSKWKLLHKTTGRWKLKMLNSKYIVGNFVNHKLFTRIGKLILRFYSPNSFAEMDAAFQRKK